MPRDPINVSQSPSALGCQGRAPRHDRDSVTRIGFSWVWMGGLLCALGCSEATYTLGQLQADSTPGDASTSDAPIAGNDASSGTGGMGGSGGVGGTGGSAGTGGMICAPRTEAAVRKGLNLYFMVDSSFAIALQPVWGQIRQAITTFVDEPANEGVGVGIRYFGVTCEPLEYAMPAVEVAALPEAAPAMKQSLPLLPLDGVAAAIAPAVTGGVLHAVELEMMDPTRDTDVLLITDGIADQTCSSDLASATRNVLAARVGTPSVKTHVVAIDAVFLDPLSAVDLTPLDQLAAAGGTVASRRVVADLNSGAQIQAALQAVREAADPCSFKLPDGFVLDRTVMEWSPDGRPDASPTVWPQVNNAAACGNSAAMYRQAGSGDLELCPIACVAFKSTPAGKLKVRLECP